MGRRFDQALDVGAIALAALIGIVVLGLAINSGPAHALDATPAGPVVAGARNLVNHVYDQGRSG